jgi:hypothetical protein
MCDLCLETLSVRFAEQVHMLIRQNAGRDVVEILATCIGRIGGIVVSSQASINLRQTSD